MKPNIWISASQAQELLKKQLVTWELARKNYNELEQVKTRTFDMGGFHIHIQFNPSRIFSSAACVDKKAIQERRCFICPAHLPEEQIRLPFGTDYLVLCNPYPILPEHFTIPTRQHVEQMIVNRMGDFLELARRLERYIVFYNGPKSGASAPDHAHFQAGSRDFLPIDSDRKFFLQDHAQVIKEVPEGSVFAFSDYIRNGFIIRSRSVSAACTLFEDLVRALGTKEDETEPMMNIFCIYENGQWDTIVIPRKKHRPSHFFKEGDQKIITSPGCADIGGVFVTARKEDFDKMTPELLREIYSELCLNDDEIKEVSNRLQ